MDRYSFSGVMRRWPKGLVGLVVIFASLNKNLVSANNASEVVNSTKPLPTMLAHYQLIHEPSGEILTRMRILMAEDGLRIDQLGEVAKSSVILNNRLDKMWLLDRSKKIFHEVPLTVNAKEISSEQISKKETHGEIRESEVAYFSEFIQFEPCSGMKAERLLDSDTELADMQVWLCRYENKVVEKQWFDIEHGLVVRSESFDGLVATVTGINKVENVVGDFEPPVRYRSVTLNDIMSISQPLNLYDEQNTLSVGSMESHDFHD